jgi:hypothetical protein
MTSTMNKSSASSGGVAVRPRLGHVAIGVADLERAASFYRDLIGLDVTAWGPDDGVPLVVLGQADHPLGVVLMAFTAPVARRLRRGIPACRTSRWSSTDRSRWRTPRSG